MLELFRNLGNIKHSFVKNAKVSLTRIKDLMDFLMQKIRLSCNNHPLNQLLGYRSDFLLVKEALEKQHQEG